MSIQVTLRDTIEALKNEVDGAEIALSPFPYSMVHPHIAELRRIIGLFTIVECELEDAMGLHEQPPAQSHGELRTVPPATVEESGGKLAAFKDKFKGFIQSDESVDESACVACGDDPEAPPITEENVFYSEYEIAGEEGSVDPDEDGWYQLPLLGNYDYIHINGDTEFKCSDGNIRQRRVDGEVGHLICAINTYSYGPGFPRRLHYSFTHFRPWKPQLSWAPYQGLTPPTHFGYRLETRVNRDDGQSEYRYVPTEQFIPHEDDVQAVADMHADDLREAFRSVGLDLGPQVELDQSEDFTLLDPAVLRDEPDGVEAEPEGYAPVVDAEPVLDATELAQVTIDKVPPTAEVIKDKEGRAKFALFGGQTHEVVEPSNTEADFWARALFPKKKEQA